jgi:hypothetical protein
MPSWRDGQKGRPGGSPKPGPPSSRPSSPPQRAKPAEKGSWRGKDDKPDESRKWQREQRDSGFRISQSFWVRTGALITIGLVGYLIYLVLVRPTRTPIYALAILNYTNTSSLLKESPLPPNSWALEDLEHLDGINPKNVVYKRLGDATFDSQGDGTKLLKTLQDGLQHERGGKPKSDRLLLVYLSAHTAVNSAGKPCILTSDADPLDDSAWLEFNDLLTLLSELHGDLRKVVFFDCGRLDVDPTLGVTSNAFVEKAAALVRERQAKNLWFLFSHGPGERSWDAPELGGTPFGYFVAEGLRGFANTGDGDNYVQLRELADFVTGNVSHWTQDHRGQIQRPLLVPNAESFELAFAEDALPKSPKSRLTNAEVEWVNERLEPMQHAWAALESELAAIESPDRASGLTRGAAVRRLVAAEQRLVAGKHYHDQLTRDTLRDVEASLKELRVEPDKPILYGASRVQRQWRNQPPLAGEEELWKAATSPDFSPAAIQEAAGKLTDAPQTVEAQLAQMVGSYADWSSGDPAVIDAARAALLCRQAAELAHCPIADESKIRFVDLRFLDWTQTALQPLDAKRRVLEDRLFANDWKTLADEFNSLATAYGQQRDAALNVARAQVLIEESLSELIDTSRWPVYLSHLPNAQGNPAIRNLSSGLRKTIEMLGRDSHNPSELADELRTLKALRQELTQYRNALTETLRSELRSVTSGNVEGSRMRNARAALRIPSSAFVATDRQAFRNYFVQQAYQADDGPVDLAAGQDSGAAAGESSAVPIDPLAENAALEVEWIDELIRTAEPEGQRGGEKTLRSRLQAAAGAYDILTGGAAGTGSAGDFQTALRLAQVITCGRDLSSPQRGSPNDEPRVLGAIQSAYLGRYVAWQTDRTLDDFLGPQPENSPGDQRPFFERIARQQLADAPKAMPDELRRGLESRLQERSQLAAARIARLDVHDLSFNFDPQSPLPKDTTGARMCEFAVQPTLVKAGAAATPWPQGEAAAWISDGKQACVPIGKSRRLPIPIDSPAEHPYSLKVAESDPLGQQGGRLLAFFRGHTSAAVINVSRKQEESRNEDFKPGPPTPPRVIVDDSIRERPVVFIVLDCSASMDTADIEGEGGVKSKRWDVAIETLKSLLNNLAAEGRYEVGLIAFGHRFRVIPKLGPLSRYATESTVDALSQSPIPGGIGGATPEEFQENANKQKILICNFDTETLEKPVLLNTTNVTRFLERLNSLAPWGNTPLYGAIKKAVDDLAPFEKQPRHIIVVSDGMNQMALGKNWIGNDGVTFDVLKENVGPLENRRVPIQIDVVGIGAEFNAAMEGNGQETPAGKAFQSLREIAQPYFAADQRGLMKTLQDSLSIVKYQVVPAESPADDSPASRLRPLGEPWVAPATLPKSTEYVVRVQGGKEPIEKRILLEGGEQLRMVVDRTARDPRNLMLRIPRYGFEAGPAEDGRSRFKREVPIEPQPYQPFRTPDPASALKVANVLVHQAKRLDSGWMLPVSFQSGSEDLFSPRPAAIWVEAFPVFPDGVPHDDDLSFDRFDRTFLDNRPVPVFPVTIQAWPAGAANCRLNVDFSYSPIAPDRKTNHLEEPIQPIESLPGVEFKIQQGKIEALGQYVVVVSELHSDAANAQLSAMVTMSPAPARIRRRFFTTSPRIDHEFYFDADSIPGDAELAILSQKTFKEHSLHAELTCPLKQ